MSGRPEPRPAKTRGPRKGTRKALIAGAGIGGLTAAVALQRIGYEVEVYERASALRPIGSGLAFTCNALTALHSVGIHLDLERTAQRWNALTFKTRKGRPIRTIHYQHFIERFGVPMLAVHRADIQQSLLRQLEGDPVTYGVTATGYVRERDGVRLTFSNGESARGDLLVGADGFNSAIRRQVIGAEQPRDGGYICWLATPMFSHPVVTPGYAAHYWGRGERFGLADLGGGRVYWWGTKNMPPEQARDWKGDKAEIARVYAKWAPEISAVIEATPADAIINVPAQDRPFRENWGDGPVTLLGDAAHPMMTSLGQGANMAIEDGVVLAQCLANAPDIESGLRRYEDLRRPRTRAMVEASLALSRIEQMANPVATLARRLYFRFVPESKLDAQNELALTFQGATP